MHSSYLLSSIAATCELQGEFSQMGTLFLEVRVAFKPFGSRELADPFNIHQSKIDSLRALTAEVVDWDVGPLLLSSLIIGFLACWR